MTALWLTEIQAKEMVAQALRSAPDEACGILAGRQTKVEKIIPINNVADDPTHFFFLDPQQLAQILPDLYAENLDILAYYHSHPRGNPIPSTTDIASADFGSVHLIIGLRQDTPQLAAWEIKNLEVDRVELSIGLKKPIEDQVSLSRAQHYAILLSTLIAVLLVLIISFSLLPPAPPIP